MLSFPVRTLLLMAWQCGTGRLVQTILALSLSSQATMTEGALQRTKSVTGLDFATFGVMHQDVRLMT
jgi:hypothetical protein